MPVGQDADEGVDEVSAVDEAGGEAVRRPPPATSRARWVARRGEDLEVVARRGHVLDRVEDAPLAEPVQRRRAQADAGADLVDLDACSYTLTVAPRLLSALAAAAPA